MLLATEVPYTLYFDKSGKPLDGGYIYFGVENQNPETNSIDVFWDSDGTQPVAQPVRTVAGFPVRAGTIASVYCAGAYSITIRDQMGALVRYAPSSQAFSLSTFISTFVDNLLGSSGATLVGRIANFVGAVYRTVQDSLRDTVSVRDFGSGNEIGALLNAAIAGGAFGIKIPQNTAWVATTPVVTPIGWRGRIFAETGAGVQTIPIKLATGNNVPFIDAQGASFFEMTGLHLLADDSANAASACAVVIARMPSGASSSNHKIVGNVIEGPFYYCGIYNVGSEELLIADNYIALYGTAQAVSPKIAPVVHQLSEDAFYSAIVTKAARTSGTSTSAIEHRGNQIKNQNAAGCSMIYLGPNVNDIDFADLYGFSPPSSYCISTGGYVDGIKIGFGRIETDKSTPIFSAPVDSTMGLVSIYKGAYRRSGAVDPTHYAIDIGGTTASSCSIHIAPEVSWTSGFGGNVEDVYLVRSTRKTVANLNFMSVAPEETLVNTKVNITQLVYGDFVMGLSANLTLGSVNYGYRSMFFYDTTVTKPAHVFHGGVDVSGGLTADTSLTLSSILARTTVGAAGGASALPATPLGYMVFTLNGTTVSMPYYNP